MDRMNSRRKYPGNGLIGDSPKYPIASQTTIFIIIVLLLSISMGIFLYKPVAAQIGENTTVISEVNVTNAPPTILNITAPDPINLVANGTKFVTCNATVRDYNGFNDISNVNAKFYDINYSSLNAADANRTHYTNSSCSFISNSDAFTADYECGFNVAYYANPYKWNCSIHVNDSYNVNDSKMITTNVSVLIALSTPDVVNYGDLPVLSTSPDITANVTNVGNRDINISLYGYNATPGDGLAMQCQYGNITYVNQKWALTNAAFGSMNVLNNTVPEIVPGLTILQRNTTLAQTINTTHWKLYVAQGAGGTPFGLCNGTIVFGGLQASFP